MPQTYQSHSMSDLARERIDRVRIFERRGLDYCCGGTRSLAEACTLAGVELEQVEAELLTLDQQPEASQDSEQDWISMSLTELVDHIVLLHHGYLREEFPWIAEMLTKVAAAHCGTHPETVEAERVFCALRDELQAHMFKEEQVLFPIVKQLEQAEQAATVPPPFHCGSVRNPIAAMEHEHREAGEALRRLRSLTGGYTPFAGACETVRALYARLEHLERDLHLHIHKENNILFPRAAQLEATLSATAASG